MAVFQGGPKRGNPAMTTSTVTARRKGDPQHMLREIIVSIKRWAPKHVYFVLKISKNQCKTGGQKLIFSTLLRTWGEQGSIVSAFFDVLVRCQKTMFF